MPAGSVHWPQLDDVDHWSQARSALCGAPLLAREAYVMDVRKLTCEDCAMRCLIVLQQQQSFLMQRLAVALADLLRAVAQQVKRD